MFGYEPYKICGAILFALLLVTLLRVGDDAMLIPEKLAQNAYVPESQSEDYSTDEGEGEDDDTDGGEDGDEADGKDNAATKDDGAAEESEEPASQLAALLGAADAGAGKKLTKKCKACHSLEQGGKKKIGPGLWNMVGAKKGSVEGFTYSPALAEKGGMWTYDDLDAFLTAPKTFVPKTKMLFPGLKKPQDRANLILYLHSLSDDPQPLP